jgi:dGTPase
MADPSERMTAEESSASEYRTAYQRDRDRVLYSSALRRLDGVTQVAAVRERQLLHNRLTHSLKVAQLGRRMAQRLVKGGIKCEIPDDGPVDSLPDIVETAGLAHDLGHPPFGHLAEKELHRLVGVDNGGFEGNAQSFRIVTRVAVGSNGPGLNLTRASLNSVLKYPTFLSELDSRWSVSWHDRSRGSKWGVYERERDVFEFARADALQDVRGTAAIIMDWADDVSYATHDLYDYFRAGLIPLHEFKSGRAQEAVINFMLASSGKDYDRPRLVGAYERLIEQNFPDAPWSDTVEDRRRLSGLLSNLIGRFASAIVPTVNGFPPYVEVDVSGQYEVEILKTLTKFYVIEKPALAVAQAGQKRIVNELFGRLMDAESPKIVLLDEIINAIVDAGK